MIKLKTCFIVLAATFLLCNGVARSQNNNSSTQTIIQKMAERYATVSAYQDSGVVETVGSDSPPTRRTNIFFKTYFSRPLKMRFEWLDYLPYSSSERNFVWSDGIKTFSFYAFEPDKIETKEDLSFGIAGATGVSLGSAHTVPNLLLEEIGGFSLTELTKMSLKAEEQFEGEDCYVLEGYHPNGEAWRLWIGKKDFLLRKLTEKDVTGGFQEEIHRDIRIDVAIPEAIYHPKIAGGRPTDVIAKEKEASINHLLDLIFARDRMNQVLSDVLNLMKKASPQVPEKIWPEVIAELHLNSEMLVQIYVPIYDRLYTDEEIKELIALYESPLGRKLKRNQVLIELEAARRGETIDREIIKRIEEKLRARGYGSRSTGDR